MKLNANLVDAYLQSRHGFGLSRYQSKVLEVLFLTAFNCGTQRSLSMIIQPQILLSQTNLVDFYDVGVIIASLSLGVLADYKGRLPLIKCAIIGQILMTFTQNAVLSLGVFALLQMIQGILNALITYTGFIFFVESVHHTSRDTGIVILYLAFVFGQIYGIVIASILQSTTSISSWWTVQFIFSAIPCILSIVIAHIFLKETPFYLLQKEDRIELNTFINYIQRIEEDSEDRQIREADFDIAVCKNKEDHDIWEVVSRQSYQGATQILFTIWFILEFIFRGTLTVLPWMGGLPQQQQIANNFKYIVMYEISGCVPAFIISLFIIKQVERKYILIMTFIILAIFQFTTNFNNYFVALWVIATNNLCNFVLPVLTLQTLELFPTQIRATIFGISQVCRTSSCLLMYMCVNLIFNMTLNLPFSLFTVLSIACMILSFLFKDNSKELSLDYMSQYDQFDIQNSEIPKYVELSEIKPKQISHSKVRGKKKQSTKDINLPLSRQENLSHQSYYLEDQSERSEKSRLDVLREKVYRLQNKHMYDDIQNPIIFKTPSDQFL